MASFQLFATKVLVIFSIVTLGVCLFLYHTAVTDKKSFTIKTATYMNVFNCFRSVNGCYLVRDNNGMKENIAVDTVNDIKIAHNFGNTARTIKSSFDQLLDNFSTSRKTHKEGVILVQLYAEQQVGAAMNMFSLQKWAKTVNASVVEPFVVNSELRLPSVTSHEALSKELRFSDYFNIETWNELSIQNNGTPLISWEYFLDHIPTKYIFVNVINDLRKDVEKPVHVDDEIMNEPLCKEAFLFFIRKYSFYIDKLVQAKLVRRLCFSFYKTRMNINDFTKHITS